MLKESGNLLEEGIPITKELLTFCKQNGYRISLKNGDYLVGDFTPSRAKNDRELVSTVFDLYIKGDLHPGGFFEVFGFHGQSPFTSMLRDFAKSNSLDFIKPRDMYSDEIKGLREETNLKRFGAKCNFSTEEFKSKRTQTNLERFGVDNPMKAREIQEKVKETNLEKYGSITPLTNPQIQEKSKQTILERYGVDNAMKDINVKLSQQATLIERYGVHHPSMHPEFYGKAKETSLLRYGAETPAKSPIIQRKIIETNLKRYGNPFFTPGIADISKALKKPEAIARYEALFSLREALKRNPNNTEAREALYKHITENYSGSSYYVHLNQNGFRDPKFRSPSRIETKIRSFLKSNALEFQENVYFEWMRSSETNRKRELDFWIPNKSVAIEVNGNYTHSFEYGKPKEYHLFKFQKCWENGVTLVMVTEEEIYEKFDFVEKILSFHLLDGELPFIDETNKVRLGLKSDSFDIAEFKVGDFTHHYPI